MSKNLSHSAQKELELIPRTKLSSGSSAIEIGILCCYDNVYGDPVVHTALRALSVRSDRGTEPPPLPLFTEMSAN